MHRLSWVAQELKQHQKVKLILTAGSVKDVANHFKQAIYFDLNGFLVSQISNKAFASKGSASREAFTN